MSDRTINFGESETEATYQIQDTDSTGGGNFVVAKDTNANTVLLQYDPGTDTWEYAGDVDINGGNVSGVGTLTAESVNTEDVDAESVNTEEQSTTGGLPDQVIDSSVLVEDKTPQSDSSEAITISWTGLDASKTYLLDVAMQGRGDDTDIQLFFNGVDDAGNEKYIYWDESGTKIANQDTIEIVNVTGDFADVAFRALITGVNDKRVGASFDVRAIRAERIGGFAQSAGLSDLLDNSFEEIDLILPGYSVDREQDYVRLLEVRS